MRVLVAVCTFTLKPQHSSHCFGCPTALEHCNASGSAKTKHRWFQRVRSHPQKVQRPAVMIMWVVDRCKTGLSFKQSLFYPYDSFFLLLIFILPSVYCILAPVCSLCFTLTAQITDFSMENSSQRIKLFTGHVIKVNMFKRKRKQANILMENTIMWDQRNMWWRHTIAASLRQ